MDILSYLSELIQTRKTIGVSGLGTIYKKKLPGRYDAETHSFVPPSYTISFTQEVNEEIILAEFISKKRNVSTDTANYFIDEFSNGILQQLNDHQEAEFGDLGKLYKDDDGLHFEPSEKLSYGFDFFGLPVVKAEQEPSAEEIMPETPPVEEIAHSHIDEVIPYETPAAEISVAVTSPETAPIEEYVEPAEEPVTAEEPVVNQEEEVLPLGIPVVEEHIENPEEITPAEPIEEPVVSPVAESVITPSNEPVAATVEEPLITPATEPVAPPVEEPVIETVVPRHENIVPDSPVAPRKDEKQLRAEIEALNFYRSKSPAPKNVVTDQEEVIWNIKENTKTIEPAPFYNKNEELYTPEEEEEPVAKTTPLYLKIILGLLILVIMMIVAYIVKPEWFDGIIANNPLNTPKTEQPVKRPIQERYKPDSTATADTTQKTVPATPATAAVKPVKKDSVAQQAVVKTPDTGTVVYEVMAASMHDQKEADKFIEQMKKSGITAKVVTNMSGRKLKISIATLKDNETAKLELERLTKKLKIPKMYIYKNKQ
ncbi:hypothetical protein HDF26_005291 [Pedobacter cryoconitis]|uniref:hypothetical protein n=1 Tax=Pedobacter cryoconitis TaxID=188932 RepID=UPI00160AFA55|nr:hypothetical protein [Pedobacter cryoconitis]MBB6274805.1 hypothetical protein [Pedobacter cryoconitis]